MVGRFLFGMVSGGVLVAGAFVVSSALFPLGEAPVAMAPANAPTAPEPEEPAAEAPATSEPAAAEGSEPEAEAPAATTEPPAETALTDMPDETPAAAPAVEGEPAGLQPGADPSPASDAPGTVDTTETAETAPASTPEPTTAPADTDTEAAAEAPEASPEPETAAETPAAPDPAPESETVAEATPEPAPPAEAPTTLPTPDPVTEAPPETAPDAPAEVQPDTAPAVMPAPEAELPGTEAPAMPGTAPETLPEPEVATLPEPAGDEPSDSVLAPDPGLGDTEGVIVGRLPRVGDAPVATEETPPEAAPEDTRPLVLHAAPFENPENKPLMSIVLIDPGTPDLDRAALAALPFPVALALDPLDPATPEHAAIYRAAGKEVVMLATGIANGAQASDIEVAFQSMEQGLPEAVAVMDLAQLAFQSDRPLASMVVPVVGAQGRGLLTWDQGLNAADQVARREDIPAAMIFRDFAAGGGDRGAVRRLLDRAVFKAGQDGRVVLAGTASAELVAAILEWTVEGRAATVAIAPVSATLTVD